MMGKRKMERKSERRNSAKMNERKKKMMMNGNMVGNSKLWERKRVAWGM